MNGNIRTTKGIVTYGSHYGTTERYAKALAERLGFPCVHYKAIVPEKLAGVQLCIHGGGLYAGGMLGLTALRKALEAAPDTVLYLFTVGASDPAKEANITAIRKGLSAQLPQERYQEQRFFHLRGGIDYSKMSFLHRTIMRMVVKKAKKTPPEQRDAEMQGVIETFGSSVDFVDIAALEPLLEQVMQQG